MEVLFRQSGRQAGSSYRLLCLNCNQGLCGRLIESPRVTYLTGILYRLFVKLEQYCQLSKMTSDLAAAVCISQHFNINQCILAEG